MGRVNKVRTGHPECPFKGMIFEQLLTAGLHMGCYPARMQGCSGRRWGLRPCRFTCKSCSLIPGLWLWVNSFNSHLLTAHNHGEIFNEMMPTSTEHSLTAEKPRAQSSCFYSLLQEFRVPSFLRTSPYLPSTHLASPLQNLFLSVFWAQGSS